MKLGQNEIRILIYRLESGRIPYLDWFESLSDRRTKQKIQARIGRTRLGNFGCTKSVGGGVQELRINYGPGYRIYFGRDGNDLVILLCAGDKSTQNEDIEKAKQYWKAYKQEKENANR
jgi:putative addiction module killer protein